MAEPIDVSEERLYDLRDQIKGLMIERARLEVEDGTQESIAELMEEVHKLGREQHYIYLRLKEQKAVQAEADAEAQRLRADAAAQADAQRAQAEAEERAAAEQMALNLAPQSA